MIVKNEEAVLERCLKSVKHFADEIVIVDTGSSDRTVDIAKQFTKNIFSFEWCNDFSAARNESIKHATGKWVLVLDADEFFMMDNPKQVRAAIARLDTRSPASVVFPIYNLSSNSTSGEFMKSSAERMFTRVPGLKYHNPIHEQLTYDGGALKYFSLDIPILHTGYIKETVEAQNKSARNMSIFENMDQEKLKDDPYFHFTYANELVDDNPEEALRHYRICYKHSLPVHSWFHHLLNKLARLCMQFDQYSEAWSYIEQGLKLVPDKVDYHCLAGMALHHYGQFEQAEQRFLQCVSIADNAGPNDVCWLVQSDYGKQTPYKYLLNIYRQQWDTQKSVHYLMKILQHDAKDYKALQELISIFKQYESWESVLPIISRLYADTDANALMLIQLARLYGYPAMFAHYENKLLSRNVPLPLECRLYASLLKQDYAESLKLAEQAKDRTFYKAVQILLSADVPSMTQEEEFAVVRLLKSIDRNDLIQQQLDRSPFIETYQTLADYLYARYERADASDLYHGLLDLNSLHAKGFYSLFETYRYHGHTEAASQFLKEAAVRSRSITWAGLFIALFPSHDEAQEVVRLLLELDSEAIKLPFFLQLSLA